MINYTYYYLNYEEIIMAIVNYMERIATPPKKKVQSTIRLSKYFVANDRIQVSTFGSATRKNPEVASQIVAFEGRALDQLRDALIEIYENRGNNAEDQHKQQLLKSFSNIDNS